MAQSTSIEWTDAVWNFVRGCSRVSDGCKNCYAERVAARFAGPGQPYEGLAKFVNHKPRWTGEISFHEDILLAPLKRKKPTTYFVNSMSDLFYEKVKDEWLDKAFAVMALTPQHTYQILTKRPERMREYVESLTQYEFAISQYWLGDWVSMGMDRVSYQGLERVYVNSPLKNVWLGVSVEDQETADERIPLLLETPAAVRWVSAEPLLGPVDIDVWVHHQEPYCSAGRCAEGRGLDWIVVGGESGPGARPFDIQWARNIIAQCKPVLVPVFVKQLGAYSVQPHALAADTNIYERDGWFQPLQLQNKKGGDPSEWPLDLRIRQMPEVAL